MDGLRKQLFVCTSILKVALQINSLCWRYKQLFSKSTPTLVVQTVASKSTPYPGRTNSCTLKSPLCCRYKHLLSKSTLTLVVHPYAGGTTLRWWYWCRRLVFFFFFTFFSSFQTCVQIYGLGLGLGVRFWVCRWLQVCLWTFIFESLFVRHL